MIDQQQPAPGKIILFGSGETSPTGRKIFEQVFRSLPMSPRLALLETPAGFQPNSHQVISSVGDFFTHRLQNYSPQVNIIPARHRGTLLSPDAPDIVAPILNANMIFMGPGSPTYAIRQLRESLALNYMIARHFLGACLAFASAATIAVSAYALPVYEIYKVGEELHWIKGLDLFNYYGLKLVFIPHWNNCEGGEQLDTSRCFMGKERFSRLCDTLPEAMTIVGLDEKTALILDPGSGECHVIGLGNITLLQPAEASDHSKITHPFMHDNLNKSQTDFDLLEISRKSNRQIKIYRDGQNFSASELGSFHTFHPETSIPPAIWRTALEANSTQEITASQLPTDEVMDLIQEREVARNCRDWSTADKLREQLAKLGWEVVDTIDKPIIRKMHSP